jgi:hypothetical protein
MALLRDANLRHLKPRFGIFGAHLWAHTTRNRFIGIISREIADALGASKPTALWRIGDTSDYIRIRHP